MTAPNTRRTSVGFRHCQVLLITSTGYPAATGTTAYEGVQVEVVHDSTKYKTNLGRL